MSLNTTPGSGKSGMSRMKLENWSTRPVYASRLPIPQTLRACGPASFARGFRLRADAIGDGSAADPQLALLDLDDDVVTVETLHLALDASDRLDLVTELQRLGQLLLLLHPIALGADDQEVEDRHHQHEEDQRAGPRAGGGFLSENDGQVGFLSFFGVRRLGERRLVTNPSLPLLHHLLPEVVEVPRQYRVSGVAEQPERVGEVVDAQQPVDGELTGDEQVPQVGAPVRAARQARTVRREGRRILGELGASQVVVAAAREHSPMPGEAGGPHAVEE